MRAFESVNFGVFQCKCYAPGTRISKPHLDSFIAASARDPFTARIVTGLPEPMRADFPAGGRGLYENL